MNSGLDQMLMHSMSGLMLGQTVLLIVAIFLVLRRSSPVSQMLESRQVKTALGILTGVALLVRCWVIPSLTRHVFDGHEADYFDAWRGARHSLGVGYRASPWMGWLYEHLGPLVGGNGQALIGMTIACSLLAIPVLFVLARALGASVRASVFACLLLALDPVHGFWASSAYNIMVPFVLQLSAWAILEIGIARWSRGLLIASGLFISAAVAARTESLLLLPLLIVRLASTGGRLRSIGPVMAWCCAVAPALVHVGMDMQALSGQTPLEYSKELALQQWSLGIYLTPWSGPGIRELVLLLGLLAAARAPWVRPRLLLLLAFVISVHAATIVFDDYDFRHTLLSRAVLLLYGALGLTALDAALMPAWSRFYGWTVSLFLVVLSGLQTMDIGKRYYATWEEFQRDVSAFSSAPYVNLEQYRGCVFVAEDAYYARYARASHFELYTQRDFQRLSARSQGCILFVLDLENYQASSRSIDGRAAKLFHFYELTLLGKVVDRSAEHASLVYQVGAHR